jgi:hypothetical protein
VTIYAANTQKCASSARLRAKRQLDGNRLGAINPGGTDVTADGDLMREGKTIWIQLTNKRIHMMRCAADNNSNDDEYGAH